MSTNPGWLDLLGLAVKNEDAGDIAIAIGVLAVGAAVAGWRAHRYLHHTRTVQDIPTSKARSAHQGYVELEGVGRDLLDPPLHAPFSGLPCLWFRCMIEEHVSSGGKSRWQVVSQYRSHDAFWLEDETGRIQIDPDGAEITPRHKDLWNSRSGLMHSPVLTPDIVKYLLTRASSNPHRFTEERLMAGEPLYALGLLKNLTSLNDGPTLADELRTRLNEWKADQPQLKARFDLDKDGKIDEKEWMLARAQAKREVEAVRKTNRDFSEGINIMTAAGDSKRPYLLSAHRQSQLVKRYRLWLVLYGAGFFAAGSVALWLFNARFG